MDTLLSIARLIHKQQVDVVGIKDDKADELLGNIVKRTWTDDELENRLYPGNKYKRTYFNQLKRSLKDRLINSLFARNPKNKDYWEIYFDLGKKALACDLLWNKEQSKAAAEVAQETLKAAIKYECTQVSFSLCKKLAGHYAVVVSEPSKYRKYKELSNELLEKIVWESKADEYYYDLAQRFRKAKTIKEGLITDAERYKLELQYAPDNISWTFEFLRTLVSVYLEQVRNNGSAIIETCERSLDYFRSLPFDVPNRPIRSITFRVIPAYLQTGQIIKAEEAIELIKGKIPKTGYNWIAIYQYEAIVGFYKNDLELSSAAIKEIKKSKLSSRIKEEIRIYETYQHFLNEEKLRLGTFLNDTPKFSLDKKGMNINRVILRMLILLSRDDRPGIIDRVEALEMYAYRYLKKDPTVKRSQLFLRLLFLVVRYSFDWEDIEKHTAKTLDQLKKTPRHLSTIDVEVVPYETLWSKVQSILGG